MLDRFKRDPVKRAKRHVDKALEELEDDYPEYASVEYEKAARLFVEAEEIDFAVKYFREAAYCSLEKDDHLRSAEMKIAAGEVLLIDNRFAAAGGLYSEASDHQFRMKKTNDSGRSLAVAIVANLGGRSFDTAVNLLKKAEKRQGAKGMAKIGMLKFAQLCVQVLFEGQSKTEKELDKALSSAKCSESEGPLIHFVAGSVRLALKTDVVIEWAGKETDVVNAKTPLEFELRYKCPVPVRVTDYRYNLSNGLRIVTDLQFSTSETNEDSWLLEVIPDLSGDGTLGPFRLTLEGQQVLVHKPSNLIKFRIERAPSDLRMDLSPTQVSCSLGDEAVLDVTLTNDGDGPADNVKVRVELSEGLQTSLGGREQTIQFIGSGETMKLQVFVRPVVTVGEEQVTVKVVDERVGEELVKTTAVTVG
ncbi:MAG: hypothetical protein RTU92_00950 [Candidatus Thorarchaeota archaeon]